MKKIFLTMLAALSLLNGGNAQTKGSEIPDLKQLYALTDSLDVNLRAKHSPLIGLSASINDKGYSMVSATYINSIEMSVKNSQIAFLELNTNCLVIVLRKNESYIFITK